MTKAFMQRDSHASLQRYSIDNKWVVPARSHGNRRFSDPEVAICAVFLWLDFSQQPLFDHTDAFDLTFGGKTFIEAFVPELVFQVGPPGNQFLKNARCRVVAPLRNEIFAQREIRQNANEGL